jgi:uncharacterized protein (TIGR02452 family)
LAQETLNVVNIGEYAINVELRDDVESCMMGTEYYSPEQQLEDGGYRYRDGPRISVRPNTTLYTAQQLCENHTRVGVLNFASGKNPGGGFLRGTEAQEETLARSSALYNSLTQEQCKPYYDMNRESSDPFYTDAMIWSPDCPVFRDDEGNLLPDPYTVDILTCAAPNYRGFVESSKRKGHKESEASLRYKMKNAFEQRLHKVLQTFDHHGVPVLLLGAWGCGVFGNDPTMVAKAFLKKLQTDFREKFEAVIFAIPPGPNHNVFAETLLTK